MRGSELLTERSCISDSYVDEVVCLQGSALFHDSSVTRAPMTAVECPQRSALSQARHISESCADEALSRSLNAPPSENSRVHLSEREPKGAAAGACLLKDGPLILRLAGETCQVSGSVATRRICISCFLLVRPQSALSS